MPQQAGSRHIHVGCPSCQRVLNIRPEHLTMRVSCKHCLHHFSPRAEDVLPSEPPLMVDPEDRGKVTLCCPGCLRTVRVRRQYLGLEVVCKYCEQSFVAQEPEGHPWPQELGVESEALEESDVSLEKPMSELPPESVASHSAIQEADAGSIASESLSADHSDSPAEAGEPVSPPQLSLLTGRLSSLETRLQENVHASADLAALRAAFDSLERELREALTETRSAATASWRESLEAEREVGRAERERVMRLVEGLDSGLSAQAEQLEAIRAEFQPLPEPEPPTAAIKAALDAALPALLAQLGQEIACLKTGVVEASAQQQAIQAQLSSIATLLDEGKAETARDLARLAGIVTDVENRQTSLESQEVRPQGLLEAATRDAQASLDALEARIRELEDKNDRTLGPRLIALQELPARLAALEARQKTADTRVQEWLENAGTRLDERLQPLIDRLAAVEARQGTVEKRTDEWLDSSSARLDALPAILERLTQVEAWQKAAPAHEKSWRQQVVSGQEALEREAQATTKRLAALEQALEAGMIQTQAESSRVRESQKVELDCRFSDLTDRLTSGLGRTQEQVEQLGRELDRLSAEAVTRNEHHGTIATVESTAAKAAEKVSRYELLASNAATELSSCARQLHDLQADLDAIKDQVATQQQERRAVEGSIQSRIESLLAEKAEEVARLTAEVAELRAAHRPIKKEETTSSASSNATSQQPATRPARTSGGGLLRGVAQRLARAPAASAVAGSEAKPEPLDYVLDVLYESEAESSPRQRAAAQAPAAVAQGRSAVDYSGLDHQFSDLLKNEQWDQALELAHRLAKLSREQVGTNHTDHALWLRNLGSLYLRKGDPVQGEPYLLKALDICRQAEGDDGFSTAICLTDLAELRIAEGRVQVARDLCDQALRIFRTSVGHSHPLVGRVQACLEHVNRQERSPQSPFGSMTTDT